MAKRAQAPANPVDVWHTEHMYFGRLLELLQREVDVFETGARPNYELMLDIITYLRSYSDRYHHPREDVAFARLERRCPELRRTIAMLRLEHRVIANVGEKLLAQLAAVLDGSIVPRADIEAAASTYLSYYGNHIGREEREVLTRAAERLTAKDWEEVNAAVPAGADPLLGADPEKRYRELRRQIALDA
ncbi:MAG TPA: hemerythrin domain-containing protein [Usitatibacter sp.]|nr:hemerythrin domain-containing protein [Usitatibacter sp.]